MSNKDRAAYNAYMADYMLKRYRIRRSDAVERLGSKCSHCGATDDLEIHHVDPSQKSFDVARLWSISKARFDEEITKCVLLCDTCHIDHHRTKARHGTAQKYWSGCRCAPCTEANTMHNRAYRKSRKENK